MWSVVVPTYNNAGGLKATIDSLLVQETRLAYEIIVVDNNSSDTTSALVETYAHHDRPNVRYVFERMQGSTASRNAGVSAARGEVIAFTDDDCGAHEGWLEALAGVYRTYPDAWCVGGKIVLQLPGAPPTWLSADIAKFIAHLDLGDGVVKRDNPNALWTANFSARRRVFNEIGAFDTRLGVIGSRRLPGGEDVQFCHRVHRAGGSLYYCGQAVVRHSVRKSRMTKKYFRQVAYEEGVMEAHPLIRGRASAGRILREILAGLKDCGVGLGLCGMGRLHRAFQYELAVRSHVGYLWTLAHDRAGARGV